MSFFSKFQRLSALSIGSVILVSFCYNFENLCLYYSQKLKNKTALPSKWNHNWDRLEKNIFKNFNFSYLMIY